MDIDSNRATEAMAMAGACEYNALRDAVSAEFLVARVYNAMEMRRAADIARVNDGLSSP